MGIKDLELSETYKQYVYEALRNLESKYNNTHDEEDTMISAIALKGLNKTGRFAIDKIATALSDDERTFQRREYKYPTVDDLIPGSDFIDDPLYEYRIFHDDLDVLRETIGIANSRPITYEQREFNFYLIQEVVQAKVRRGNFATIHTCLRVVGVNTVPDRETGELVDEHTEIIGSCCMWSAFELDSGDSVAINTYDWLEVFFALVLGIPKEDFNGKVKPQSKSKSRVTVAEFERRVRDVEGITIVLRLPHDQMVPYYHYDTPAHPAMHVGAWIHDRIYSLLGEVELVVYDNNMVPLKDPHSKTQLNKFKRN